MPPPWKKPEANVKNPAVIMNRHPLLHGLSALEKITVLNGFLFDMNQEGVPPRTVRLSCNSPARQSRFHNTGHRSQTSRSTCDSLRTQSATAATNGNDFRVRREHGRCKASGVVDKPRRQQRQCRPGDV